MRETKFRGKRLDNGKWAIGDLRHHNDGSVTIVTNLNVWPDNNDEVDAYGEEFEVAPATVGEYTGLKDKNGKEIYEGDIFKEDSSGIVRSVFRVPGGLAFEDNPVSFGYDHIAPLYPYSSIAEMQNASWLSQCCEILGNIHDNPELQKGGEK